MDLSDFCGPLLDGLSDLGDGEIGIGSLALDVVFPSVEIEGGVEIVEHGGFVQLEPHGVEGFGVVGFAAGDDDAGVVVGIGGGDIDLRPCAGVEGLGAEGEVALVPPHCLGDVLTAGAAVVDNDDGGLLIEAATDLGEFAEGVTHIGVFVNIPGIHFAKGVHPDAVGGGGFDSVEPLLADVVGAEIDKGVVHLADDVEEDVGIDQSLLLGCEGGGHFEIVGLLAVDAVFGADEKMLEGLRVCFEPCEGPAENL